jgi:Protein of unknown function (DUF2939)
MFGPVAGRRIAPALGLSLLLSACATGERLGAAQDVHAFLLSVRDNDRASFEAHVDRRALEGEMQRIIAAKAANAKGVGPLKPFTGLLAIPVARAAGDALIRPEVFRFAAEYYGYRPGQPVPNVVALAVYLTPVSDDQVCARHGKPPRCLLTFAKEGATWRLVSIGDDPMFAP